MTTYCTTYYLGSSTPSKAVSGTLTAEVEEFGKFEGVATRFITDGNEVYFSATHQINDTEWSTISWLFPADIENNRHEFHEGGSLKPPFFSQNWKDPDGGIWARPHSSRPDAGYVEITFNLAEGTLNAKFNFIFNENPTGVERQVVGDIDAKGLEHVKRRFPPNERWNRR